MEGQYYTVTKLLCMLTTKWYIYLHNLTLDADYSTNWVVSYYFKYHYLFSQLLNWNRIECLKLSTNAWCFSDNYEFLALPPPPHKSQLICRKSASHRLRLAGWARSLLTKSVGCLSCLLVSGSRHHNPQSTTTFPKPSRMKPTERLAPSHLSVSGVLVAVPWRVGKWQYQPKISFLL